MISCSVDLVKLLSCSEWGEAELINKFVKNGFVEAFAIQPFSHFYNCSVLWVSIVSAFFPILVLDRGLMHRDQKRRCFVRGCTNDAIGYER